MYFLDLKNDELLSIDGGAPLREWYDDIKYVYNDLKNCYNDIGDFFNGVWDGFWGY